MSPARQAAADLIEENYRQRWLVRNGHRNYGGETRAVRQEQIGVDGLQGNGRQRRQGQTRSVPSGQPLASWKEVALALVFLGALVPVCAVLLIGHGVVVGVNRVRKGRESK